MFLPMLVTEGAQGMLDPGWGCGGGGGRQAEGWKGRQHVVLTWSGSGKLQEAFGQEASPQIRGLRQGLGVG